jgi:hypothetical protein
LQLCYSLYWGSCYQNFEEIERLRLAEAAKLSGIGYSPAPAKFEPHTVLNRVMNAGGPGSGRHSAGGGHFVEWDKSDPATHAFGKAYHGKVKEGGMGPKTDAFANSAKAVGGQSGFGGSGHTVYEHGGNTFRVDRYANGKGFWGTDHSVSKIEPAIKKNDTPESVATKKVRVKPGNIDVDSKLYPGGLNPSRAEKLYGPESDYDNRK